MNMVIGPLGEIIYQKAFEEDVFTTGLDKQYLAEVREKFQFWRDRDEFKICP